MAKARHINCHGVRISYDLIGQAGPTLVFLHGNSGCKAVFERQLAHFKDSRFRLLAIDLPGHGGSEDAAEPQRTYTIPGYARLIEDVLQDLGIGSYILVGWSLGGNIALEMAGASTAANGMMIFGAPPVGPGMDNLDKAYLPATFETAIGDSEATKAQIETYIQAIYGTLNPVPEAFKACAHRTDGRAREIMVNHWMSGTDGYNQQDTVSRWKNPICVVHGQDDPFVNRAYLDEISWNNLWRETVFTLTGCGHAPFIEAPAAFNTLLEDFANDVL